ncbi:unnamed protein product [Notodromas monacha]|uniref:THO complex subunit 3 n=1 Tax=Notodromas monacha TaxID=399045 RepID=A0A7R9GFW0_9CRUS|nr:unnamed protein product [Notodromas monacha]CAG0919748.1 unnamed protein product [Notodromas monacha]
MGPDYGTEKYLRLRAEVKSLKKYFKNLPRPKEAIEGGRTVDWSADGRYLAASSYMSEKTVCLFALVDDRKLVKEHTFRGHHESVDVVCWHKTNGDLLSTASGDKSVRIWDARAQKCQACIQTKGENINLAWSPDGNTIAVGNKSDLVSFIDVRKFEVTKELQFSGETNEIAWNNENTRFFATLGSGQFDVLSFPDLELLKKVQAHTTNCIALKVSPNGERISIGAADALVSIWDTKELICLRTLARLEWPVRTLSFSHDSLLIASGSEDLVIDIAHVESGEKVAEINVHMPSFTVAWHPKRYLLAYSCDDKFASRTKEIGSLRVFGLNL